MPETWTECRQLTKRRFSLWSVSLSHGAVLNHAAWRCSCIDSEWWQLASWKKCVFKRTKYWLLWKKKAQINSLMSRESTRAFRAVDGDEILHPSTFYDTQGPLKLLELIVAIFWRGGVWSHHKSLKSHMPRFRICDVVQQPPGKWHHRCLPRKPRTAWKLYFSVIFFCAVFCVFNDGKLE